MGHSRVPCDRSRLYHAGIDGMFFDKRVRNGIDIGNYGILQFLQTTTFRCMYDSGNDVITEADLGIIG